MALSEFEIKRIQKIVGQYIAEKGLLFIYAMRLIFLSELKVKA
jgi:hypothetical protein